MLNKKYKTYVFCFGVVALLLAVAGCVETPPDEDTDSSLSGVLERGKLIVGSDIPYAPMEFWADEGVPVIGSDDGVAVIGLDIDIVEYIAGQLGVSIEVIDYDWVYPDGGENDDLTDGPLFDAVNTSECDIIISSITITIDRAKEMLFSDAYLNCGQVIVINASNEEIDVAEDLYNKTIGAQTGTTSMDKALELTNSSLVVGYTNYSEYPDKGIVYDLKNGTLHAIITDLVVAVDMVQNNPSLKIVDDPLTQEYFGIATKKGNKALMDEINDILKQPGLDEIKADWGII